MLFSKAVVIKVRLHRLESQTASWADDPPLFMSSQEGAEYSVELSFRVNNLVSGLKYLQVVRRMGTNGAWLILEICAARSRARAWPVIRAAHYSRPLTTYSG